MMKIMITDAITWSEDNIPSTNLINGSKWHKRRIDESNNLTTMIQNIEQAEGSANKNIKISITIQVNDSRRRINVGTESSSVNAEI